MKFRKYLRKVIFSARNIEGNLDNIFVKVNPDCQFVWVKSKVKKKKAAADSLDVFS